MRKQTEAKLVKITVNAVNVVALIIIFIAMSTNPLVLVELSCESSTGFCANPLYDPFQLKTCSVEPETICSQEQIVDGFYYRTPVNGWYFAAFNVMWFMVILNIGGMYYARKNKAYFERGKRKASQRSESQKT